ncbi:MAG: hypothetical protein ACOX5G_04610 [Kiritimatiellia bacterium]|jgi:hypothetical protein
MRPSNRNPRAARALAAGLALALAAPSAFGGVLPSAAGGKPGRDAYPACWGVDPKDFARSYQSNGELELSPVETSCDCNMAYPGETLRIRAQFRNLTGEPLAVKGRWILVRHGLRTGKDVFDLSLVKYGEEAFGEPVALEIAPKGAEFADVVPPLPETFGAAAVLFEPEGGEARRLLLAAVARIVEPDLAPGLPAYQVCMDLMDLPEAAQAITRLHTAPNRMGMPFLVRDDFRTPEECERRYEQLAGQLRAIHATGYPVSIQWGAGQDRGPSHPTGRTRPHLDEDDVLLETKSDFAWLPSYDAEFKERVKWLVKEFGYPKGPVNSLLLWNEPWNGMSISGWGADDLRYREIYRAMCEAAEEAMAEDPSIHVLLGGCDSSANTFDKLFPDVGPGEEADSPFLKWLDFVSIHYQGLAPSNPRFLRERKHKNGRTRFWDTESWVANSEDRVPGVIAGMLAAGHDRLVGIQAHAVVASTYWVNVVQPDGKTVRKRVFNAWPVAPALAAFQHFVGNRPFVKLAWEGLPWVYEFADPENPDDMTFVVTGDISPAFDGAGRTGLVPFRTCKPANGAETLAGTLTLANASAFSLFDGNGNRVGEPGADTIRVPLDDTGFYLRPDGSAGSAAALRDALASARIDGYSPVAPALRDATTGLPGGATFQAVLKNVLNRPLRGTLSLSCPGLELAYQPDVELAPHATAVVDVKAAGPANAENTYPVTLRFDAGPDGTSVLEESLHCNVIAKRSISVDGDLSDWDGALVQPVKAGGDGATQMERAWLPMIQHEDATGKGVAAGYVAADDDFFYFAARIADDTPHPGMIRFSERDEDADFYPPVAYEYDRKTTVATRTGTSSHPFSGDGDDTVWQPLVDTMSFHLDAPPEGARLAIRSIDDDGLVRRWITVTVRDADAKTLSYGEIHSAEPDTWFTVNVAGPVEVEIGTRINWLKTKIAAIALDPAEEGLDKPACDTGTGGAFDGKYGTLALFTPAGAGGHGFAWKDHVVRIERVWPEGVRRYSYRRRPLLPQGLGFDNVQIAFNVLPDDAKRWYPFAPGTFKGYAGYWDTDYEFALNPVAEAYGGGVEIWRNRAPYLPDKHYYPHSVPHPREGAMPVGDAAGQAKLVIRHEGGERIVEAAIPWAEIPEAKAARDAGRPIKFTYRVNDNAAGSTCMELARMRSISKRNESFKPHWTEHWANELLFGWEE